MSEHQPGQSLPHTQQESDGQQAEGSIVALILVLVSWTLCFVAVLSVVSGLTGWKIAMKGATIPAGWGSALAFLVIAGIFWGIAWIIDNPTIRKALGAWFWVILIAGLGLFGYTTVYAINVMDAGGFMMYAVSQGHVKKVESYLKGGKISPEQKVKMLRKAVSKRRAGVVRLLLDNGVDPNTPEAIYPKVPSRNYLVFHWACTSGDLEMIKPFVEKKVSINAMSKDGKTPLDMMMFHYYSDASRIRPAVAYMVEHGAKLNLKKLHTAQRRRIERDYPQLSSRLLQEEPVKPAIRRAVVIPVRNAETDQPSEVRKPTPRTQPREDSEEDSE